MKRRTAMQVVTAAIGAGQLATPQHHVITLAQAPQSYRPQFFDAQQIEMLAHLTEMIIPADDHSPGAGEAKVGLFIDLMIAHSAQDVQEQWRSGLTLVDAEAQKSLGEPFLRCDPAERNRILEVMAAAEAEPNTDLEQFFAHLKLMTIDGYYTSTIGIHRELRYKGNDILSEFPGCRHSDH